MVCSWNCVQSVTALHGWISRLFGTNDHDKIMCYVHETCHKLESQGHGWCATLRQTTLRLLRHFVESFSRITSSSKSNFVECIFVEYDT